MLLGLAFAMTSAAGPGPIGPPRFDCSCDYCAANPSASCNDVGHGTTSCTTYYFCACDETVAAVDPAEAAPFVPAWTGSFFADVLLASLTTEEETSTAEPADATSAAVDATAEIAQGM